MRFKESSDGIAFRSLAYCELYLTLAHVIRWFDLELYQTNRKSMEWKENLAPMTNGPLQVLVKAVIDGDTLQV